MSVFSTFPGENPSPFWYLEADDAIRYKGVIVKECRAVKLYFVFRDRNAWHETRSTRYYDGCMNPLFDNAAQVAEKSRINGSVFYIEEIPALQFIADEISFLVTEINSNQPLQYIQEMSEDVPLTIKSIYDHFAPSKLNSIIRLVWKKRRIKRTTDGLKRISYDLHGLNVLSTSSSFKKYKSNSFGKGYLLGWNEMDHNMSQSAVTRMAAHFDSLIVNQKYAEYRSVCDEMLEIFKKPIVEVKFSDAVFTKINSAGIRFVGDLVQYTERGLDDAVSGETYVAEIRDTLAEMGLSLKPEKPVIYCDYKEKSVHELELSVRTVNVLKNANIVTVGQLVELSQTDLLRLQNMGKKSVKELIDNLSYYGLTLHET